jgi:hypothetical protein
MPVKRRAEVALIDWLHFLTGVDVDDDDCVEDVRDLVLETIDPQSLGHSAMSRREAAAS